MTFSAQTIGFATLILGSISSGLAWFIDNTLTVLVAVTLFVPLLAISAIGAFSVTICAVIIDTIDIATTKETKQ